MGTFMTGGNAVSPGQRTRRKSRTDCPTVIMPPLVREQTYPPNEELSLSSGGFNDAAIRFRVISKVLVYR